MAVPPAKKVAPPKPDPLFDDWDGESLSEDDAGDFADVFSATPSAKGRPPRKSLAQNPLNPWEPPRTAGVGGSTRATSLTGANPVTRLVARIVDAFLAFIVILPGTAMVAVGGANADSEGPAALFAGIGLLFAGTISFVVFQIILFCQGKSIGKKLFGLTVYDTTTGLPVGFLQMFGRELLPNLVSFCVPILGGIAALVDLFFIFSSDHRRLVDKVCNTVVVAD